ncbi:MAG: hypothetical protein ABIJ74_04165 [archaeon]
MSINIVLPNSVNGNNISCKDAVVSLLSEEAPLTAKQIYSRIKRKYALNVSYQAVHKSLKELEKEKMIEKNNKNYSLNVKWIDDLEKFSSSFKEKFFGKTFSTSKTYVLKSVAEVDLFLLSLFNELYAIEGKKNDFHAMGAFMDSIVFLQRRIL